MKRRRLPYLGSLAVLTAAYFCAGKLGLSLAFLNASASAVWPPTGLALAALLLLGYRFWPAVFAGAFLVNWTTAGSVGTSLAIAGGNTAEAVLGAWLARRFAGGVGAFDQPRSLFRFVFLAAIPSTAVSASVGVTALALGGFVDWRGYVPVWFTWWTGDFVSDLVVAPLLVIWLAKALPRPPLRRLAEGVVLVLSVLLLSRAVFGGGVRLLPRNYPLEYLGIPLVLWGSFRFRHHGAITCAAAMSAVAVWGTLRGAGPFAVGVPNDSLVLLQVFVGVISLTALAVAGLVTEHERAQRERESLLGREQAARGEAERLNRLKDEFLATLSHELRTPLNAILGWSQLLRRGGDDAEGIAQGLEVIENNARAQTQLIEDLLDVSRIVAGKLRLEVQRVDLAPLIEAAVESVLPAAQAKGIVLQKVLDPLAGPVRGDPARLRQVVWNLLINAIKFTPKGGRVQVALQRERSNVEILVSDTGAGIAPEFLPHVFERFSQADGTTTRVHRGLGLGLAIVKHLAEAHGGAVRAQSDGEGRGATFTVSLPLQSIEAAGPGEGSRRSVGATSTPPFEPSRLAGVTVLVVDDEPDARLLMTRLLEGCGAKVVTAASADEAVEAVVRERPHVLLSDIGMPQLDGYDLLSRVRALGPARGGAVPAVAVTGFARAEDRLRALHAGYRMHLSKPIETAELCAVVASVAGRIAAGEGPASGGSAGPPDAS